MRRQYIEATKEPNGSQWERSMCGLRGDFGHGRPGAGCSQHYSTATKMEQLKCTCASRKCRMMLLKARRNCAGTTDQQRKNLQQRTVTDFGKTWDHVREDVTARIVFMKSIMWRTTDSLRHVVGEKGTTMSHHFRLCLRALRVVPSGGLVGVGVH